VRRATVAVLVATVVGACGDANAPTRPDVIPAPDVDAAMAILRADPWLMGLTATMDEPSLRSLLAPPEDAGAVRAAVSEHLRPVARSTLDADDAITLEVFALSLAAADESLLPDSGAAR